MRDGEGRRRGGERGEKGEQEGEERGESGGRERRGRKKLMRSKPSI